MDITLTCTVMASVFPIPTLERIHWPTLLKAFGYNLPRCAVMTGALYRLERRLEYITS